MTSATFILVHIHKKPFHSYIDTGATLCFAQKDVCQFWKKLTKPKRFTIADKSEHFIWYYAKEVEIFIGSVPFIAKTIYQYDAGMKIIVGNNFLKLYRPFIQDLTYIKLRHPKIGMVKTEIITGKILRLITEKLLQRYKEKINLLVQDNISKLLDSVSSDNPLDINKNKNTELIEIFLKDPKSEINVPNNIPYTIKDVKEFTEETEKLLSLGIIRESKSPHSAPAFYVENHNEIKRNKRRMVINYKKNE